MMGDEESPKDGAAVAGAVFGAVFIYAVCPLYELENQALGVCCWKALG
jgi:hypothetical protein